MANANTPRGLSPVKSITGAPFNEQGRLYAIANDSSNTYAIGDVVKVAGGSDTQGIAYVNKAASTDIPVGVIVGFRVSDPGVSLVGNTLALNTLYLPLSSGLRYAFVVDDPAVIFEVESDATGVAAADVFKNTGLTITANQTTLGQSQPLSNTVLNSSSILATSASGSLALPLQIIGLNQVENNDPGAYASVLVKWNKHQFLNPVGTA